MRKLLLACSFLWPAVAGAQSLPTPSFKGINLSGTITNAVDASASGATNSIIRAPNNVPAVRQRNPSNTYDLMMLNVDSSNNGLVCADTHLGSCKFGIYTSNVFGLSGGANQINGLTTYPAGTVGSLTGTLPATGYGSGAAGCGGSSYGCIANPLGVNLYTYNDAAISSATPGTNIPTLLNVQQLFGGSTVNDGRSAITGIVELIAPTNASSTYRYYTGINAIAFANSNDNGTGGGAQGVFIGLGGAAEAKSGATYLSGLFGADIEVSADAGSSVQNKAGIALLEWPSDAVHGSVVDAGIWLSGSSSLGFYNAIQIDANAGNFPISSTGTIVKLVGGTILNGLDFSSTTISGRFATWNSGNSYLTGVGDAGLRGITLAGSPGWGMDLSGLTPVTGLILLPNNQSIYAKDSGGVNRSVVATTAGNHVQIGNDAGWAGVDIGNASGGPITFKGIPAPTFGTPASSGATCTTGQLQFDATYIYTCVNTNTWHRVSNGATW